MQPYNTVSVQMNALHGPSQSTALFTSSSLSQPQWKPSQKDKKRSSPRSGDCQACNALFLSWALYSVSFYDNSAYIPFPSDTLWILKSFSKEENYSVAEGHTAAVFSSKL